MNEMPMELVQRFFTYDHANGGLIWREKSSPRSPVTPGDKAGSFSVGYMNVRVQHYGVIGVHRVVWALFHGEFPKLFIDHINRDSTDNRIENLRLATKGQNRINACPQLPLKGAFWHKRTKRWYSSISVHKKRISLGYFDTPEEAAAAHQAAALHHFGEFALDQSSPHRPFRVRSSNGSTLAVLRGSEC